jgi:hypothetical protein
VCHADVRGDIREILKNLQLVYLIFIYSNYYSAIDSNFLLQL